ncbi:hypothetical protein DUNSADRAFT_7264 [Dunaliella salina]|uniref:Encoded protein n=1 Tax=Dunaliella salina TaxID=3046 RepID=A0ABQ7GLN7_DUNSA|nr:hypothetical protein DUNSADRAFT_7264 [Dunaliella salina]|eukprot:KAF5835525.1 hypothetical protein DUNSADRAFT_7264 [Dunaliella salina]
MENFVLIERTQLSTKCWLGCCVRLAHRVDVAPFFSKFLLAVQIVGWHFLKGYNAWKQLPHNYTWPTVQPRSYLFSPAFQS